MRTLSVLSVVLSATVSCAAAQTMTHGPMAGDVTPSSAVIWARSDRSGTMHVAVGSARKSAPVTEASDFTGKIEVTGLRAGSPYEYRVWFGDAKQAARGTFVTAPSASDPRPLTLAWGGDVAGQNVCRDATEGFPIFQAVSAARPDLFIGLGDMIYADNICEEVGRYKNRQIPGGFAPSADMAGYRAHWKYTFGDEHLRALLRRTPYFAIWDDHEVVNDFGPLEDTRGGAHLMPLGLAAFLEYNPVSPNADNPLRIYRSFRWGKHVEIVVLDTRQYRDANRVPDDPARPKTLLGREQLAWLKNKLAKSDATWKLVVSSVPMSIPTGGAKSLDGWTGFKTELADLLRAAPRNTLFVTTDVHFSAVFRYSHFQVHEFVTGPLNAGLFPNRNFDPSHGAERLFFYGPEGGDAGLTWERARPFMNFGVLRIEGSGKLEASVRDVSGKVLYDLKLDPK